MGFLNDIKKKPHTLPTYVIVGLWCLFSLTMIGWVVFASLSTTTAIFKGEIFQFEGGLRFVNYVNALVSHNVLKYLINSIIYTAISGFVVIAIACPAAYMLARFKFRGRKFLLTLFVSAMSLPIIMVVMPLFSVATKTGLTNSRAVLTILYTCMLVPFTLFFMINFFKGLPESLEEAGEIDGASPIRVYFSIMLPLTQPGIVTVAIFNFIRVWNEYFMALIFANNPEFRPIAAGLQSMVQSMRYIGDWAGLFAVVVIVFLPTVFLYIFLSEKIIVGVTGGAVKG